MFARPLIPSEAELWRDLRIEALTEFPTAFLTTVEEAKAVATERIAERLGAGHTFGVFEDAACLGIASLIPLLRAQCAHRAEIGAFFVRRSAHGKGAGDTLLEGVLSHAAKLGRWQTELHVAEDNPHALALYERHGFVRTGRLPNATIVNGQPIHDLFLVRIAARDRALET